MKSIKYYLMPLLLLAQSFNLSSQQYAFKHYNTGDGLPDSCVTCAAQDAFGFMWFGTKDGVCVFNGNGFSNPLPNDSKSISGGTVCSISADSRGLVWISTARGLTRVNLKTGENDSLALDGPGPAFSLQCDSLGGVWMVAGNELRRVDGKNMEVRHYPSDRYIKVLRCCCLPCGDIVFAAIDGSLYRYDSQTDGFEEYGAKIPGGHTPSIIVPIDNDRLLVSTNDNMVFRVSLASGEAMCYYVGEGSSVSDFMIRGLAIENDETYYIGTVDGLYAIDAESGSQRCIDNDPLDRSSLSSSNIRCLFMDRMNRLWVGTFYNGLDQRMSNNMQFYRGSTAASDYSIRGSTVRAICSDYLGNIWVGTEDGYLNCIESGGKITSCGEKEGLPTLGNYHSLVMDGKDLVVGTHDKGVYRIDPIKKRVVAHYVVPNAHCVVLYKTNGGQLYMGSDVGLYLFERKKETFEKNLEVGRVFVHSICEDRQGIIWCNR